MRNGAKFKFCDFRLQFLDESEVRLIVIVIVIDMSPAISTAPVNQQGSHAFDVHVEKQPKVMILKRPTVVAQPVAPTRPKPMKSLEQREQEYAQARLRILGCDSMTRSAPNAAATTPASHTIATARRVANKIHMKR